MEEGSSDLNRECSTATMVYMFKKKKLENVKKKKKKEKDKKTPATLWQMIKCLLRQSSKSVKCWSCLLSVVTLQKS